MIQTGGQGSGVNGRLSSRQATRIVLFVGVGLVLAGFLTPWISYRGTVSFDITPWKWIEDWTTFGKPIALQGNGEPYLALIGVLLAIIGGIAAAARPRAKALWAVFVSLGGVAAVIAALWALVDIGANGQEGSNVSVGYGYGIWLTLIGGALSLGGAVMLETLLRNWNVSVAS